MNMHRYVALGYIAVLSACSTADALADPIQQPLPTPTEPDALQVNLLDGGGYTFSARIDDGGTAITRADIVPGVVITPGPLSGTAIMEGRFDLERVGGLAAIAGPTDQVSGPLTLAVDFGNNTLTTTAGDLQVEGQITGTSLDGTVTFDGRTGVMQGAVGADQAIGVFAHESSETIFAGGFYAASDQ